MCISNGRKYIEKYSAEVWLVALATLYNKIFPGYQPCQMVKRRKEQRFEDHLRPRLQVLIISTICPRLQGTDHQYHLPSCSGYRSSVSSALVFRVLIISTICPRRQGTDHQYHLPSSSGYWSSDEKTRTEMVLETLVVSPLNQLTRLVAREYFIILQKFECRDDQSSLIVIKLVCNSFRYLL
jgi:hypothetical protein